MINNISVSHSNYVDNVFV